MALAVASGSFLSNTSTGNFAVTGVGFQGKLLMLWGGRMGTALADHANAQHAVGFAVSSTNRCALGGYQEDAVGTSIAARTHNVASCYREIGVVGTGTTTVIDLDFVSWDSDGFTLNQVTADATASRLFYLVLGGSDLTNVNIGTFDQGATDTDRNVTGVGFQPTLLFLMTSQHFRTSATLEGNVSNMMTAIGCAKSTTSRWFGAIDGGHGNATPSSQGILDDTHVLQDQDPQGSGVKAFIEFVSFDADGFTLNYTASASTTTVGYLWVALAGTFQASLGTLLQKTSTGTQAYTGTGFQPTAALFLSTSRVASASISADAKLSLGVALSASNRRVLAVADDGNDPSINDTSASEAFCIRHLTAGTPTIDAEADLDSFDADGFTLDWSTADATARETAYLALASAAAGGGPPGRHHLLLMQSV